VTPHPKRKLSKGRRDRRRAHDALGALPLVVCPNCRNLHLAHHVCPSCGQYDSEQIVEIKAEEKK
jgi:large subunit ribosomal protein L32